VHLVGDPDLMRMPDDVATAPTPLPTPSIDLETSAAVLTSALVAITPEPTGDPDDATTA